MGYFWYLRYLYSRCWSFVIRDSLDVEVLLFEIYNFLGSLDVLNVDFWENWIFNDGMKIYSFIVKLRDFEVRWFNKLSVFRNWILV